MIEYTAIGILAAANISLGSKIIFDWLKNGKGKVLEVQIIHINEAIQRIDQRLTLLPCVKHGETLARLEEKVK